MATKLIIGKSAPKSFALKVEVPTSAGPGEINFEAKHLASTVWAKMREAHADAIGKTVQTLFDAARQEAEKAYANEQKGKPAATGNKKPAGKKAAAANADAPEVSDADAKDAAITALIKPVKESDIATLRAKHSADLIAQIVTSWDLDEPLGAESLTDMCDTYPGAAEAVFRAYNETREGLRLGN